MTRTKTNGRIITLDVVRGVAVMGIVAVNVVAFAMPIQAYFNPTAYGGTSGLDLLTWAFNFVFVDGRFRGLFSFLFGASLLLVITRAAERGYNPIKIHFRRMFWLLIFGLVHFYFVWVGDILFSYAVIGMVAYLFWKKTPKSLLKWAIGLLVLASLQGGLLATAFFNTEAAALAPNASPVTIQDWREMAVTFRVLAPDELARILSIYGSSYADVVHYRLSEETIMPFFGTALAFAERLALMLLGMAALKNGFLTGVWQSERYRRVALLALGVSLPAYAAFAAILYYSGFRVPLIFMIFFAASIPFRTIGFIGYAALIILIAKRGGPLLDRIAAAGRTAFTNYLGTSLVATTIFYGYGLGLFGQLSRAECYLFVVAIWGGMLLWSKPWLERYQYGPFEWLWRSLARWELQPMQKVTSTFPAI